MYLGFNLHDCSDYYFRSSSTANYFGSPSIFSPVTATSLMKIPKVKVTGYRTYPRSKQQGFAGTVPSRRLIDEIDFKSSYQAVVRIQHFVLESAFPARTKPLLDTPFSMRQLATFSISIV